MRIKLEEKPSQHSQSVVITKVFTKNVETVQASHRREHVILFFLGMIHEGQGQSASDLVMRYDIKNRHKILVKAYLLYTFTNYAIMHLDNKARIICKHALQA